MTWLERMVFAEVDDSRATGRKSPNQWSTLVEHGGRNHFPGAVLDDQRSCVDPASASPRASWSGPANGKRIALPTRTRLMLGSAPPATGAQCEPRVRFRASMLRPSPVYLQVEVARRDVCGTRQLRTWKPLVGRNDMTRHQRPYNTENEAD